MWDPIIAQKGIGGEAIIWLIIAFLWVVAQLASRAKEKARARELARQEQQPPDERERQQRQPQQEERSGKTFESEMRRFLEQIGAEVADKEQELFPEPEPAPAPPPQPRQRARRTVPRREQQQQPPIHLVERQPPSPTRTRVDTDLGAIDTSIDESVLDTDRAYEVRDPGQADSINAFVNPRTLLVNLNYLRMNMPMIPISGLDTTNEARPRPTIHGRKALRDSLTAQIMLSNPLAMGEDKASYTKRVV